MTECSTEGPRGWFWREFSCSYGGMPLNDKGWRGGRNMRRLLPPMRTLVWFGERSPLSVWVREGGILFFSIVGRGRRADNHVNERERSHLEQTGGVGGSTDLPVLLRFHVGLRHTACKYYTEGIHYKGLTARLSNSAGFHGAFEWW